MLELCIDARAPQPAPQAPAAPQPTQPAPDVSEAPTKPCKVHQGETLTLMTSERTGKKFWGHRIIDTDGIRRMCFGRPE